MKIKPTVFFPMTILALAAVVGGCATSKPVDQVQQTESMLIDAGFRAMPASTPSQMKQLQTLRPGMISAVKRNGKQYYVYPDFVRKMLYVGNQSQYLAYQSNLSDKEEAAQYDSISKSDPAAAAYNNETELLQQNETFDQWRQTGWGPWDMPE